MGNEITNFLKKENKVEFNWAKILYLLTYISYGFFGVISKYNNDLFTILTILSLIFFYILSTKFEFIFKDNLNFKNYEIFNFLIFFVILIIINLENLNFSLFGDELAHTIRASRTSIYAVYTIIEKFDLHFFNNIKFKYLVHFINFNLLIILFLVIFLIYKFNNLYVLGLIISLTIIFRLFLKDFGMHPPLDHIPSFLIFSILGISDFNSNLSYLIGFTFLQLYLFKLINKKLNFALSFFSTISIFTIPILIEMSTWTESAIWSSMFLIIITIEIFFFKKINYLRLISIISIATLFRVTVFISLLPILIFYSNEIILKKISWNNIKKTFFILSPTLLFIPFVLNSVFFGTPSFSGISDDVNFEISFLKKINLAIETNIIWITILNSIPFWWIFFIFFVFLIFDIKKYSIITFLVYFLFSLAVYYSINSSLWGLAKYASEYALPFCILGFLNIVYFFNIKNFNNKILILFLTILICFNIYEFKKLPFKNKKQDLIIDTYQDDIKKLNNDLNLFNYKLVYNLKDSFDYIKSKKLAGNTYVIGTTYGFLPEIINGYTVKEILSTKKIIDKQNYLKKNKIDLVERLKKDKNIQAILITDLKNRAETIKKLKNNNWKLLKKFENSKYGSTVYLLVL